MAASLRPWSSSSFFAAISRSRAGQLPLHLVDGPHEDADLVVRLVAGERVGGELPLPGALDDRGQQLEPAHDAVADRDEEARRRRGSRAARARGPPPAPGRGRARPPRGPRRRGPARSRASPRRCGAGRRSRRRGPSGRRRRPRRAAAGSSGPSTSAFTSGRSSSAASTSGRKGRTRGSAASIAGERGADLGGEALDPPEALAVLASRSRPVRELRRGERAAPLVAQRAVQLPE